jgi:four helix bundle protein
MTDIGNRLLDFASNIIRLTVRLQRTATSRYLANQLMRSASSSGANYREACGAESKADFVHKMQIVLKELRETEYWLQLLARADVAPADALKPLTDEVDELIRILVKSVVTAKERNQKCTDS